MTFFSKNQLLNTKLGRDAMCTCALACISVLACTLNGLWIARAADGEPGQRSLLAKYDFERDDSLSSGIGKQPDAKCSGRVELSLDEVSPHGGKKCLVAKIMKELVADKENAFGLRRVLIPPTGESDGGRGVRIKLYMRSEGVGQGNLKLRLLEEKKSAAALTYRWCPLNKNTADLTACPDWTLLEFFAPVSDDAVAVYLSFQVDDSVTAGKLCIDDVSLEMEQQNQ